MLLADFHTLSQLVSVGSSSTLLYVRDIRRLWCLPGTKKRINNLQIVFTI